MTARLRLVLLRQIAASMEQVARGLDLLLERNTWGNSPEEQVARRAVSCAKRGLQNAYIHFGDALEYFERHRE